MRFSPVHIVLGSFVTLSLALGATPAGAIDTGLPPELEGVGDVLFVPDPPPAPKVDTCSLGPSGKRLLCYEPFTDEWGTSQMKLCVYSAILGYAMPWYSGSRLGCVSTSEWGYVPVTGVCVTTVAGDPTACVNNSIARDGQEEGEPPRYEPCFMWTSFFRVCDDPDS